jgi:carbon monoxide dehydrogenase subunit G
LQVNWRRTLRGDDDGGSVVLPVDRTTVWAKLYDPDVVKICIPGCQSLERASP